MFSPYDIETCLKLGIVQLLPPANVVCEGYVFTPVCDSVNRGATCMVAPGGRVGACVVAPVGACMVAPGGACMVAPEGYAWLLLGGMRGCSGGGHAWLLQGGMRGCSQGACVVAPGGGGGVHGI